VTKKIKILFRKMKIKLEYIWLDGGKPEPSLRSKTKVLDAIGENNGSFKIPGVKDLPIWNFDGSSTGQAKGNFSEVLLKPVRMYENPLETFSFLVLCETLDAKSKKPHESNTRSKCETYGDLWIGFEQEYVFQDPKEDYYPLGFKNRNAKPQGDYYCGVGYGKVTGREIANYHLDMCLACGINITGINAEVLLGQWEYQIFSKDATKAADDLWISRYLLERITEKEGLRISWSPKPIIGDWNGSGLHTNFSTLETRDLGGEEIFKAILKEMEKNHEYSIENYGSGNDKRLTGDHETQSIDKFTYGVGDRGASVRIPTSVRDNHYAGYLEDRRPAANADPYLIVNSLSVILKKAILDNRDLRKEI